MAKTIAIPDSLYIEAELDKAARTLDNASLIRLMYERGITSDQYERAFAMYYQVDEAIRMSVEKREDALRGIYDQVQD